MEINNEQFGAIYVKFGTETL